MRGFKNKKAVAWIVMLVFLFTCVMPSGTALAGVDETHLQIVAQGETSYYLKGESGTSSDNDVQIFFCDYFQLDVKFIFIFCCRNHF